jgi:glycolate oxidase iron-sulfur subunit
MQTFISQSLKDTETGRVADEILRSCVHCGFCNATCPTYQLLGDERDGPRGRIYLIKEVLEGKEATRETQSHLDRCLTCRACETTCPSGVQYHRLLEIGREAVEKRIRRPAGERFLRRTLLTTLSNPAIFGRLLGLARLIRPLLPASGKKAIPARPAAIGDWPKNDHPRKVLLMEGCVQSAAAPQINRATARVLDRIGVTAIPAKGCCGAMAQHMSREERTLATARGNIDAWWPQIELGAEAVLLTASGCAPTVLDYGRLLKNDPDYAKKAVRISEMTREISSFLADEDLEGACTFDGEAGTIAFHAPCTLQHGLRQTGTVEKLMTRAGFRLTEVRDAHLCCGSAGTYSILQRKLSRRLLANKLSHLERGDPALIATANIGCLMHLQSGTERPVMHWVEVLDRYHRV